LIILTIKLILPIIELTPEECNLKIPKITENLKIKDLKGGYRVQDVFNPNKIELDSINIIKEKGKIQNLNELTRG